MTGFLKGLWRGILALGASLAAITTAFKGYRETWRELQELVGHDLVTNLANIFFEISFVDWVLLVVAVLVVSLFVWVLHTGPRERGKHEFTAELEKRTPGLPKRKRRRNRK